MLKGFVCFCLFVFWVLFCFLSVFPANLTVALMGWIGRSRGGGLRDKAEMEQ